MVEALYDRLEWLKALFAGYSFSYFYRHACSFSLGVLIVVKKSGCISWEREHTRVSTFIASTRWKVIVIHSGWHSWVLRFHRHHLLVREWGLLLLSKALVMIHTTLIVAWWWIVSALLFRWWTRASPRPRSWTTSNRWSRGWSWRWTTSNRWTGSRRGSWRWTRTTWWCWRASSLLTTLGDLTLLF